MKTCSKCGMKVVDDKSLKINEWSVRRVSSGLMIVQNDDGSGVLLNEDSNSIAETLFYRIMDEHLSRGGKTIDSSKPINLLECE